MARRRKFGTSFSWRRATGVSAAKAKLSRAIGIPLTRAGRQRKIGREIEKAIGSGCASVIVAISAVAGGIFFAATVLRSTFF